MCGIYGVLYRDRDRPLDQQLLQRMDAALRHRGPDGTGVYAERGFGMGMRRLSIIDLKTGQQPIANEDGTVWVVFNGEIYNYRELTTELIARGHEFRTASDTEVLVHLYEDYGEHCVDRLRGMFAFAIWTPRDETLFLARDRLGIKPLFYADVQGIGLFFGSELKAILCSECVDAAIDNRGLVDYLQYGYVPDPHTIVRGVKKLLPGHTLTVRRDQPPELRAYWRVTPLMCEGRRGHPRAQSPEAAATALWSQVRNAVSSHLISDVPLGVFLSGGLDSSAIVAAMAEEVGPGISTFSVGFEEPAFNELAHARRVAKLFGTEHHEIIVQSKDLDVIDDVLTAVDEPFADASAIPTYLVAALARKHVKVVLAGDGGDEIFAGYTRYARDASRRYLGVLGDLGCGAPLRAMSDVLPEGTPGKNLLFSLSLPRTERYLDEMRVFTSWTLPDLLEPSVRTAATTATEFLTSEAATLDPLSRLQDVDLRTYLPGDILTKTDRMTMAHSLEARVPLLDHHLVEFACTIPAEWRMKAGVTKHVLRRALRGRIPNDVIDRPKQGFGVPLEIWLTRYHPGFFRERLGKMERLTGVGVRASYVQSLVRHFERGHRADHCRRLWALLVLDTVLGNQAKA